MAAVLGEREAVVARELTKIHEEFSHASLSGLAARYVAERVRGEVVILVPPAAEPADTGQIDPEELLRSKLRDEKLSLRDAVAAASIHTGISRSELYAIALKIRDLL
jgi:16S rRNA (cytidine1402-2'-O)-methyltransferase